MRRFRTSRRFLSDTAGHFAMMTAIFTPVAITLAAFAVDAGALFVEKRRAQALADLASITAAANVDKAADAALAAFADNGIEDALLMRSKPDGTPEFRAGVGDHQLVVVTGSYRGESSTLVGDRFGPGDAPANAVRVTYRTKGTRYFAGAIIPAPDIQVSAIASAHAEAAFSVGSRLAALDGGIANALLGGLTGTTVSLSVMDYDALLSADVDLLQFLDLLATELDLDAATYDDVLDAEVSVGALARTVSRMEGVGGTARTAAGDLADALASSGVTITLGDIVGLGDLGAQALNVGGLTADVGVLELLTASAAVAGRGRQVDLDLAASLPGLLSVAVDLAIGEPPQHGRWFQYGPEGERVRTAQTRLSVVAEIGGLGGLLGARIRVPLYLELAYAEARLKSVSCPSGQAASARVAIDARPGIANLSLAEVDPSALSDFASPAPLEPATLVDLPLVTVTGQANAEIAETRFTTLTFSASDIASGKIRQVSTDEIVASLTASLFQNLELDVDVAGLGLGLPPGLAGSVGQALGAAAPALDDALSGVLELLGVSLGEADVRVHAARCGRAVLVQ